VLDETCLNLPRIGAGRPDLRHQFRRTGPAEQVRRDPKQLVDEDYSKKIKEYTTEPFFLSPLVDYLPASKTVPTPKAVLGDIAGAPGKLPYTAEVARVHADARDSQPGRVKVFSLGGPRRAAR